MCKVNVSSGHSQTFYYAQYFNMHLFVLLVFLKMYNLDDMTTSERQQD